MNDIAIEKKIPVECYSRVVGYFRPISQWNAGKKQEFNDRYEQDSKKIVNDLKTKI